MSVAILLSRQHLRPSSQDSWVQNLIQAVNFAKSNGWILNSSIGTPNWDIITACASINGVPLRLFVGEKLTEESEKFLARLNPVEVIELETKLPGDSNRGPLELRDAKVIDSSEVLIPVSIRPNGTMSELIVAAEKNGTTIIRDFGTKYENSTKPLAYCVEQSRKSSTIREIGEKYLIHWTRTSNGPWPNEGLLEYYRDILNSKIYPRSANDTLRKIINDKMIIASSKNMPGKAPTVSFSGMSPLEAVKLMKWRARYRQMTFEPFGIGISADVAESYGLKKVHYYDPDKEKIPESIPKWLTQSIGKVTDWRHECEYRHFGNFGLSKIPVDKLIFVCHFKTEAEKLKKETGVESIYFGD
ncbi:MAG TPA: hypothetical protein VHP63_01080 [candidate division Zixibacteria bacterium]|nr:hypothetical protein [candidate division Zixibacteria bacterium]